MEEAIASRAAKFRKLKLKRRNKLDRLIQAVVTGFGIGYLPMAPGTWASGTAVLLVALVHWVSPTHEMIFLVGAVVSVTPPAVVFSTRFSRSQNHPDPSMIVIDEILGQVVCLLWVPVSLLSLLAGFLLFRFFDIVKPFPVRNSERLPGGMGIVADDLVAGLYAGLSLFLIWLMMDG
ncbi:phosphatidylglycerophosphatase A [Acidobacteria bacterium AH-259-D05]|nr:phosphatidylglycerophosphatase A [Acidobacteria bacterium AH-259-D05]